MVLGDLLVKTTMKPSEIAGHLVGVVCGDCLRTHEVIWAPDTEWVKLFCLSDGDNHLPAVDGTPCKRCLDWFSVHLEE
jgi:hypothetical protein